MTEAGPTGHTIYFRGGDLGNILCKCEDKSTERAAMPPECVTASRWRTNEGIKNEGKNTVGHEQEMPSRPSRSCKKAIRKTIMTSSLATLEFYVKSEYS